MLLRDTRRGGILSGLLIAFAIFVVLAIVGGLYIARNVRVQTAERNDGEDVSIDTPAGRLKIRAHKDRDPAAVGVPIYPGAKREKDSGGASFEWTSADGMREKQMAVSGAKLFTPDSFSTVREYYRTQLPDWTMEKDRDGWTKFEMKKNGERRIVAIREKNGGTSIGVASIGEPASN